MIEILLEPQGILKGSCGKNTSWVMKSDREVTKAQVFRVVTKAVH